MPSSLNLNPSPLTHVAIIMDGNRRWAKARGLPSAEGHAYAAEKAIEPIIEHLANLKVPYVTFWALSTENWKRDKAEIAALMTIFRHALGPLATRLMKRGAKMRLLGDISRFPKDIAQKTLELVNKTQKNTAITVTFALNYGGRDEILRAVRKALEAKLKPEDLTEEQFTSYLDTAGIPDPDLVIRTGGEKRLSGYLPWQSVYAELHFVPTLFPDFTPDQLNLALSEFAKRDRRFGGDSKQRPLARHSPKRRQPSARRRRPAK